MKNQIDENQFSEMTKNFPPSPRDPRITAFGIAQFVFYFIAGFCAWKLGEWWGLGLVISLFIIDTLSDFVHEEHRQELIELHGKLTQEIAENSDILERVIPTKEG